MWNEWWMCLQSVTKKFAWTIRTNARRKKTTTKFQKTFQKNMLIFQEKTKTHLRKHNETENTTSHHFKKHVLRSVVFSVF